MIPVLLLAALLAGSPQQGPPLLQPRTGSPADEHPTVVLRNHATRVLPEDASGLYRFGNQEAIIAEGVQIDEQFGDVTGYLTIKSSSDKGKSPIVAYFFSRVEGGDGDFSFTTKAVHGLSYSFEGKIVRGPGASRAQDGFYLMTGELLAHDDTRQTSQRRTISLKLAAQH